jgi:hypothetical protein
MSSKSEETKTTPSGEGLGAASCYTKEDLWNRLREVNSWMREMHDEDWRDEIVARVSKISNV